VLTKLSGRKVESVAAETSQAAYRAEADALEL
jgi:hypothetical protein